MSNALMVLVVTRLNRIRVQMERLAERFAAGTLQAPAPRVAVASEAVETAVERAPRAARVWPHRFGWMLKLMSWQAAGYGAQLRHVLAQPEMVALLKACPQAVRIMRPMCRMLAVETALLRPGVPAKVRVPKPKAPRKKRPSDLIYYPPRGGPGLGCPSTLVINRRTGHVRYKLPWHKR